MQLLSATVTVKAMASIERIYIGVLRVGQSTEGGIGRQHYSSICGGLGALATMSARTAFLDRF